MSHFTSICAKKKILLLLLFLFSCTYINIYINGKLFWALVRIGGTGRSPSSKACSLFGHAFKLLMEFLNHMRRGSCKVSWDFSLFSWESLAVSREFSLFRGKCYHFRGNFRFSYRKWCRFREIARFLKKNAFVRLPGFPAEADVVFAELFHGFVRLPVCFAKPVDVFARMVSRKWRQQVPSREWRPQVPSWVLVIFSKTLSSFAKNLLFFTKPIFAWNLFSH